MATLQAVRTARNGAESAWQPDRAVSIGLGILAFAVMTALGAHVRIPLPWTPVPITLQTFFVSLAGATLGPLFGPASQCLYLAAGTAGVPVFSGGAGGLGYLLGTPTAGYLLGFVPGTASTGWLLGRRKTAGIVWILFSMGMGTLAVYLCGAAWLMLDLRLSLVIALSQGILPFLLGDLVKLSLAAGLVGWARRGRRCTFP